MTALIGDPATTTDYLVTFHLAARNGSAVRHNGVMLKRRVLITDGCPVVETSQNVLRIVFECLADEVVIYSVIPIG